MSLVIGFVGNITGAITKILTSEIIYRALVIFFLFIISARVGGTKREVARFTKQDKKKIRRAKKLERIEKRKQNRELKMQKALEKMKEENSNG